ncbi:hypothetical protein DW322_07745 [Rhodococcus rhodnii]|uniref:DUF6545 domain-containing protein n=2 Tax=Rhodococcus rhodnii TaxID=38312 RepID=R7WPN3_9NOCA|nr:MAB_1171c family putative transporter [Rhodococcus rhodnii]EOM75954.1 hypothetical protein Rrhod_2708 [Rhodococcus rhodnii LMG 5362]TXG90132.1 hypothetical protein DW322_07745 [Rhodococcus rhodnii]
MVTEILVWLGTAFVWVAVALRFVFRGTKRDQRAVDCALVFGAVSLLLSKRTFGSALEDVVGPAQRSNLSNSLTLFAVGFILVLVVVWRHGDDAPRWIESVAVGGVAVFCMALFVISADLPENTPIHEGSDAASAAYLSFYSVPLLVLAFYGAWVAATASRRGEFVGTRRWTVAAVFGFAVLLGVGTVAVLAAAFHELVSGSDAVAAVQTDAGPDYRVLVVAAGAAIAISPVVRGGARRWAARRHMRRLRPMWRDLTSVAPEVVLRLRRRDRVSVDALYALHRMCVEIRDAVTVVGGHLPDGRLPEGPAEQARVLAAAVRAHARGEEPVHTADLSGYDVLSPEAELHLLVAIADHWPALAVAEPPATPVSAAGAARAP